MNKKNIIKMLIVFAMMLTMMASTMTVFAAPTSGAVNLVGNGVKTSEAANSGSSKASGSKASANTAASEQNGETANASANTGAASTVTTAAETAPAQTTAATTSVVAAETGVVDQALPFAILFAASLALFCTLFHFYLNDIRYKKSARARA